MKLWTNGTKFNLFSILNLHWPIRKEKLNHLIYINFHLVILASKKTDTFNLNMKICFELISPSCGYFDLIFFLSVNFLFRSNKLYILWNMGLGNIWCIVYCVHKKNKEKYLKGNIQIGSSVIRKLSHQKCFYIYLLYLQKKTLKK